MDISDMDVSAEAAPAQSEASPQKHLPVPPVKWKDPRFQPAIDSVRSQCGFITSDREDDPIIGMCALAACCATTRHDEPHTPQSVERVGTALSAVIRLL